MTTYPDLKNEPELLKIKTRDDEIKNLKNETEKHDHENILKSLKSDNESYKKKYKSLKKESIINYHRNFDWVRKRYFNEHNVINKSKHRYSTNIINSFINISCYFNHE